MKIDFDLKLIPVIVTLVAGIIMVIYSLVMAIIEYQAGLLLEELNAQSIRINQRTRILFWNYSKDMTDENLKKKVAAEVELAKHSKDAWAKVTKLPWKHFSNFSLKRQLSYYAHLGSAALDQEKHTKLNKIIDDMENIYSTAKVCPLGSDSQINCTLMLDPELTNILTESRDPEELKHVWLAWRDAVGPKCRGVYEEFVDLSNEAARLNNFKDMSEMLLDDYEDDTFRYKIDNLWDQVRPLYDQLHAYIRTKLREKYGDIVSSRGPIPAHLLGNMWAQSWMSVHNFTLPYPNVKEDVDLTDKLKQHDFTPIKIFKTAEDFYKSINLTEMPDSFWEKSVLVKLPNVDMVCHASSWDFYNGTDFRISQCTEVTRSHFVTAHHEMGHVEYFMQYRHQPFPFRDGANDGFHEAIGDLISLSVQSTKHLRKIGLYDYPSDSKAQLNNLFKLGLFQIPFLPFAYLTDLWRWNLYTGKIKSDRYNCHWWELKEKYQGVEPPIARSEKDFDPAAKYHIVANVPYLRYFISQIIQYQLHLALCTAADEYEENNPDKPLFECDIYQNKKAGTLLKSMLAMGCSRPWPEALEVVTGQREMDASGFIKYFRPLHDWLINENKRTNTFIGWEPSDKVCSSDTG